MIPTRLSDGDCGWRTTITTQRLGVAKILRENPSLRPIILAELADAYAVARVEAAAALEMEDATMPETCPWRATQVLDADFWPEA